MGHIISDLKENFKRGNIYIQLIYINAGVFLFTSLLLILLRLFNRSGENILLYVEMPASLQNLLHQPWSIFTYMFMHADFLHILFNMLWLYWFGQLFLYFFSSETFTWLVCVRRRLRCCSLYDFIQLIPLF